jgi:hypothetical protein
MHNYSVLKSLFFIAILLLFSSCDKDYSGVGESLIGENNFEIVKYASDVVCYNEKINPIQSENLPVNALGIYDNPAFGVTTANFVTQLTLASLNPIIGNNPVIDSVYIDIPYFVDADSTVAIASKGSTYVLDSIYGKKLAKIKLSVYESGRYMGVQSAIPQVFYTNQNAEFDKLKDIDPKKWGRLNNDDNKVQNDEFFFNPIQNTLIIKNAEGKETSRTYSPPSMRLKLNSAFFKDKIIDAAATATSPGSGNLATNDVFINYFKGLYFKVEQSGADKGSLAMINFRKGTITIKYKEDLVTETKDANGNVIKTTTRPEKSILLNMSGNTVSLLEDGNLRTEYTTAINNPDRTLGDKKLFLKGGQGSLAVIELFKKPNELDNIRKDKWLINEANLVFYIDDSDTEFKKSNEPERIFLYNFTNNTPMLDYISSAATTNKNSTKLALGGFLKRNATGLKRGVYYKINVTNHIRSLVNNTSAVNVKLGLVVTEDINIFDFNLLEKEGLFVRKVPKSSVMNPLGTILYGTGTGVPEDKKLKLEINYTKPK